MPRMTNHSNPTAPPPKYSLWHFQKVPGLKAENVAD